MVEADGTLQKFKINAVTKTADYTVVAADSGTFFNNLGAAGAVVFTLPTATDGLFFVFTAAVLAQNVTVTATPVDTMVVFNDIAADSIAFSTANRIAGNSVLVWSDGAKWYTALALAFDGLTATALGGAGNATVAT